MANDTENDVSISTSILDGVPVAERRTASRIQPNPYILENPVFVNPQQHNANGPGSKNPRSARGPRNRNNESVIKTGRVQHDDPFVYVLNSDIAAREDLINATWKTPKTKERANLFSNDDKECMLDYEVQQNEVSVFDICVPQQGTKLSLSPSLLTEREAKRNQKVEISSATSILMPGVVLLKRWLSKDIQVEIVERCRYLGIGPGGFYQPRYGAESKMHLYLMCLGMQWEPTTKSYEKKRLIDDASPPCIPPLFETLVSQCLRDARLAQEGAVEDSCSSSMETIPEMHPNICLVNFYERSGKLGLHQDRDESLESRQRGIPVVSFSIGDSAKFVYGLERDVDLADTVILESGDVLIFGGPSRMIYHGILSILPQTAPSWLSERTNLRPGRLNLTFRQF
ncbi:hypothetical protein L7F22_046100 [Adiantum nelumboides]|nr:hypothetical protein [Adiantum nelumboides]